MSTDLVKVAVRVRPFNDREKRQEAKNVIDMIGETIKIHHPDNIQKMSKFHFDYAYWSHDEFQESVDGQLIPNGPESRYASQQRLFDEMGHDMLQYVLEGYNCSIVAYGQTGSGKSYSMFGDDNNRGIVPRVCDQLFKTIASSTTSSNKFAVSYSMLEIYNERVRDLMSTSTNYLEVRQSKRLGFYIHDLNMVPVASYKEIEKWNTVGITNRTIAATRVNATSSRAHTIIRIECKQIISYESGINTKSSTISFVNLAGSENKSFTDATEDRFRNSGGINKSLSALKDVIDALVDAADERKSVIVPYNGSVLTKMFTNILGGNSKTFMIATVSPADVDYTETLSTLRYANLTRRIKNSAIINNNPMERLIRDLREEKETLQKMLNGQLPQEMNIHNQSDEEIQKMHKEIEEELRADMREKSELLELYDMTSWEEKVRQAEISITVDETSIVAKKKLQFPYLCNLNEEPQLCGVLVHFIENNSISFGTKPDSNVDSIRINGPGMLDTHGVIEYDQRCKTVTIAPQSLGAIVRVNGNRISSARILNDLDRIILGSSNIYIFHNPLMPSEKVVAYDWESVHREVAESDGFSCEVRSEPMIIGILPLVNEVNALSNEMKKQREFRLLLIPPMAQDIPFGEEAKPKIMIQMVNTVNQNSWLLEHDLFLDRRYIIQELYQRFIDEESLNHIRGEMDPFWEPMNDVLIGKAYVCLQNLGYNVGIKHSLTVLNYEGEEEGLLTVAIEPCGKRGDTDGQCILDNPNELLNEQFYLKISIKRLHLYNSRFINGNTVKFRFYRHSNVYETKTVTNTLDVDFNYSVIIELPSISKDDLQYFKEGVLIFSVYGMQIDTQAVAPRMYSRYESINRAIQSGYDISRREIEQRILDINYDQQKKKISQMKQLCIGWATKPADEQMFDPFYKEVATLAFSSGKKFQVTAEVITNSQNETIKEPQIAKITITRKKDKLETSEVCATM